MTMMPQIPPVRRDDLVASLGRRVAEALRGVSAGYRTYGLLDFPHHRNIGDSAIWLGEVQLFQHLFGHGPDYVSFLGLSADEPARFVPQEGGILFLHGGGNFGDIWPAHQTYREAILRRYPDHRVVQLPQSIHYGDPAAIETSKRAIGAHRDFHLMVRDLESQDFAARHFDCHVLLVPDSAFGIDMKHFGRRRPDQPIKCLFRSDKEQRPDATAGGAMFAGAVIEDWHGLMDMAQRRFVLRFLKRVPEVPGKRQLMAVRTRVFNHMAEHIVRIGFRQLDAAEVIVTDRLHGHIMSSLLGKPHVVIDNSYGKIANFIRAWGADAVTRSAQDYAEAQVLATGLLAEVRASQA